MRLKPPLVASVAVVGSLLCVGQTFAQLRAPLTGGYYQQSFDTLAIAGNNETDLPLGFSIVETGPSGDGAYSASTGSLGSGNTYSFGTGDDRALGEVTSASVQSIFGVSFVNNTGYDLRRFSVGFTGEQWRLGAADGVSDRLDFQYSTDASNLLDGTWQTAFAFASRTNAGPVGALDGNSFANSVLFIPLSFYNIAPLPVGGVLSFRWVSVGIDGENDGLAIDNFVLRTFPTADFDKDGDIDGGDFLRWQRKLGTTIGPNYGEGDATGDGKVDAADLSVWMRQALRSPVAANVTPEPSSLAAGLVALAFIAATPSMYRGKARRPRFSASASSRLVVTVSSLAG
jgi:hypothetical protein